MDLALLLLRGVIGLLFVAQKLFGVFGGGGLTATADRPPAGRSPRSASDWSATWAR
jgi:hypothetical protein